MNNKLHKTAIVDGIWLHSWEKSRILCYWFLWCANNGNKTEVKKQTKKTQCQHDLYGIKSIFAYLYPWIQLAAFLHHGECVFFPLILLWYSCILLLSVWCVCVSFLYNYFVLLVMTFRDICVVPVHLMQNWFSAFKDTKRHTVLRKRKLFLAILYVDVLLCCHLRFHKYTNDSRPRRTELLCMLLLLLLYAICLVENIFYKNTHRTDDWFTQHNTIQLISIVSNLLMHRKQKKFYC